MSRIGNAPISIPKGVEIKVNEDANKITVKGPKGELSQTIGDGITASIEDGVLTFKRATEQKRHKAMHGLYRALVNNMVTGVSEGFKLQLQLVGVGYRASNTGQILELGLGYSHPIYFVVPKEVTLSTETVKGKDPVITLESHDKQLVGQVAAKIRTFRKPEPYKGKGIRFVGEEIRRKAGKTIAK